MSVEAWVRLAEAGGYGLSVVERAWSGIAAAG